MTESDKYEQFIAKLIADISSSHRNIDFLGSGASCKMMGALGQKHQIDVAFIDNTFVPPKLVLIECKLKKPEYRVGPEVVKIIAFNGVDLIQNPVYPNEFLLIICSTSDFTSGAKRLSAALNIKLEKVETPTDYTFRYVNIVMAGVGSIGHFTDEAIGIVTHVDGTKD
jgi:hypothetical protein